MTSSITTSFTLGTALRPRFDLAHLNNDENGTPLLNGYCGDLRKLRSKLRASYEDPQAVQEVPWLSREGADIYFSRSSRCREHTLPAPVSAGRATLEIVKLS
ncbi:hypothetical protein FKR81_31170 [Lentzea tibetensis]|uniref:Uncharacterized protein n=1 Tax=Lentzea tibetensis TaxID=2591470 RepID=A0A563EKZ8_9PSEU|nr:hypothetical protein [Lentzea tibetensis]TWP47803.1 hypothetical protein FKR81_31170 [Lentzea tibetensis]